MVMVVNPTDQRLYTRAVTPSVEGRLRADKQDNSQEITREPTSHVNKHQTTRSKDSDQQKTNEQVRERQNERREVGARQSRQQAQESSAKPSSAAMIAEHVSSARQTRQVQHARRGYIPPALTSHRGQRANESYLTVSQYGHGRIIDEMV